jgi:hypothetical protein
VSRDVACPKIPLHLKKKRKNKTKKKKKKEKVGNFGSGRW